MNAAASPKALSVIKKSAAFAPPELRDAQGRRDLIGLSRAELEKTLTETGEKPFRARQLWHWMYHHGERDFSRMNAIARPLQKKLEERFFVGRPEIGLIQNSRDKTCKFLCRFSDGQEAETVYIPDRGEDRGAVCISSQIGCTLSCSFCHTGTQKLVRNLGAPEIVGQFMAARDHYGEWPSPKDGVARRLSNIVMMGMGEPLYNYENVAKALKILMDGEGIALSRRRITLSTAGVIPLMDKCGAELGVNLAISLHAVTNELRDQLVPLNRKYPLEELLAACARYPSASNSRRLTFEYIMLDGINDSDTDARELVRLIRPLFAKVNLIPFNPWPGSSYQPSGRERLKRFAQIVNDAGIACPIRMPRGKDILAACGQLKTLSERKTGRAG